MHKYTNRGDALWAAKRLRESAWELHDSIQDCKANHDHDHDGCSPEAIAGAEDEVLGKLAEAAVIDWNLPEQLTCEDCGEENDDVRDDWELREGHHFCGECATRSIGEYYPEDWRIER